MKNEVTFNAYETSTDYLNRLLESTLKNIHLGRRTGGINLVADGVYTVKESKVLKTIDKVIKKLAKIIDYAKPTGNPTDTIDGQWSTEKIVMECLLNIDTDKNKAILREALGEENHIYRRNNRVDGYNELKYLTGVVQQGVVIEVKLVSVEDKTKFIHYYMDIEDVRNYNRYYKLLHDLYNFHAEHEKYYQQDGRLRTSRGALLTHVSGDYYPYKTIIKFNLTCNNMLTEKRIVQMILKLEEDCELHVLSKVKLQKGLSFQYVVADRFNKQMYKAVMSDLDNLVHNVNEYLKERIKEEQFELTLSTEVMDKFGVFDKGYINRVSK